MKPEALKLCVVCKGTGVECRVGDSGLEDQNWCASCETGRAKAEMVAQIIERLMQDRATRAA